MHKINGIAIVFKLIIHIMLLIMKEGSITFPVIDLYPCFSDLFLTEWFPKTPCTCCTFFRSLQT